MLKSVYGAIFTTKKEKKYMPTKHYINLLAQAEKIRRHNRQGSYKTKERYFEAYKRFLHYLGDTHRLEKIANISGKHLSSYVESMQERGLAASTIKTDLAAIRFWHDKIPNPKYTLPENDELNLERRSYGGIDRTWSDDEVQRMIHECRKINRDDYEACIMIAHHIGLRIHEVMKIDTAIARAALKNGYIHIIGKSGLPRDIPITDPVRAEFDKLLKLIPSGHKLFVPQDKKTHIAIKALQRFIAEHRKAAKDPDSNRPMTFHGLRHSFADEHYNKEITKGRSKYKASKQTSLLLGHKRADVTRIYLARTKNRQKSKNTV